MLHMTTQRGHEAPQPWIDTLTHIFLLVDPRPLVVLLEHRHKEVEVPRTY